MSTSKNFTSSNLSKHETDEGDDNNNERSSSNYVTTLRDYQEFAVNQTLSVLSVLPVSGPPDVEVVRARVLDVQRESELKSNFTAEQPTEFAIEMETGTGKTTTYLATLRRFYKRFPLHGNGLSIVVVHSRAVKDNVRCSLLDFQENGLAVAGAIDRFTDVRFLVFDVATPIDRVATFLCAAGMKILVMTIQSFTSDYNRINPLLPSIATMHPLVVIDEPQRVEGDEENNTMKGILAIKSLQPCAVLRYSATHRIVPNLLYRLSPAEALAKGLVKRIVVERIVTTTDDDNESALLQRIIHNHFRLEREFRDTLKVISLAFVQTNKQQHGDKQKNKRQRKDTQKNKDPETQVKRFKRMMKATYAVLRQRGDLGEGLPAVLDDKHFKIAFGQQTDADYLDRGMCSLESPVKFIVTHSKLKEGWDMPNVMQIGFLRDVFSAVDARQMLGRGLRRPLADIVVGDGARRLTSIDCLPDHVKRAAMTLLAVTDMDIGELEKNARAQELIAQVSIVKRGGTWSLYPRTLAVNVGDLIHVVVENCDNDGDDPKVRCRTTQAGAMEISIKPAKRYAVKQAPLRDVMALDLPTTTSGATPVNSQTIIEEHNIDDDNNNNNNDNQLANQSRHATLRIESANSIEMSVDDQICSIVATPRFEPSSGATTTTTAVGPVSSASITPPVAGVVAATSRTPLRLAQRVASISGRFIRVWREVGSYGNSRYIIQHGKASNIAALIKGAAIQATAVEKVLGTTSETPNRSTFDVVPLIDAGLTKFPFLSVARVSDICRSGLHVVADSKLDMALVKNVEYVKEDWAALSDVEIVRGLDDAFSVSVELGGSKEISGLCRKTLYDYVSCDSAAEVQLVALLEASSDVECFLRVPKSYQIPYPRGRSYTPDFFVLFKGKVFVIEVKCVRELRDLKEADLIKQEVGRHCFGNRYVMVNMFDMNAESLRAILSGALK